jgi:hypothetical protein
MRIAAKHLLCTCRELLIEQFDRVEEIGKILNSQSADKHTFRKSQMIDCLLWNVYEFDQHVWYIDKKCVNSSDELSV